jgi:undecaprenyl-diphosphatase
MEMDFWQAILLGIVEGVTEYLPVSSTGHLILTQRLLSLPESAASNAYAICIQAGAIVAVVGLYWRRIREMIVGILGKSGLGEGSDAGFRLATNIVVAFMPAAVIGVLFDDRIERLLFGLKPIILAWFVGGVAILFVARRDRHRTSTRSEKSLVDLTWPMALAIGLLQCLAMWPGTSRSLVTIVGGVLVGLSLSAAVEFSFLLGVVTLLAATVYKVKDAGPAMYDAYGLSPMIVGSLAAWVSAVIAVKWMVAYLKRHGMGIFGYYRVGLAIVAAICVWRGVVQP